MNESDAVKALYESVSALELAPDCINIRDVIGQGAFGRVSLLLSCECCVTLYVLMFVACSNLVVDLFMIAAGHVCVLQVSLATLTTEEYPDGLDVAVKTLQGVWPSTYHCVLVSRCIEVVNRVFCCYDLHQYMTLLAIKFASVWLGHAITVRLHQYLF